MISQEIPHFNSGVSQQPAILRSPEQLSAQINCLSSESAGLIKRPPTIQAAKLDPISSQAPYIHLYERDATEKYLVILDGQGCRVIDHKGGAHSVIIENASYVQSPAPRQDFAVVTNSDYSFIVNKKIAPAMQSDLSPDVFAAQGALVRVKAGHYGHCYTIYAGGKPIASYTTPDGSEASHANQITTKHIIDQLTASIGNTYTVSTGEGWLYLHGGAAISCSDGYDNADMIAICKNVAKVSDLPKTAPEGFTVKVQGELAASADDYYLKYDSQQSLWVETICPGLPYKINPRTMPQALVSNANGTFTLKSLKWDDRIIGDDDSNPLPSFIGKPIQDIFFYKNRFGVITGEQVVLSESGSYFNFFMATAANVLDTDTIDVAVNASAITNLRHAVAFNEAMLLISDNAQFILNSEGVLTPKSITINPVSATPCDFLARPVMAGRRIYYTSRRSDYTTVREFYSVGAVDDAKLTTDITSHVPEYIANGVYKLIACTTENLLFLLSEQAPNVIYVYKYLFSEEKRLQASWSAWWFGEDTVILGGGMLDDQLYLMVQRDGSTYLERMNLAVNTLDFAGEPYRIHLDRKTAGTVADYDEDRDCSYIHVFTLLKTEQLSTDEAYAVVMKNSYYAPFHAEDLNAGRLKIEGDWRGVDFAIGQVYECQIALSPLYISTEKGKITTGRLQLRYMQFNYEQTGLFQVLVEAGGRSFTYTNGNALGNVVLGNYQLQDAAIRFPIHTRNTNCTIQIISNNPTPLNIVNAIWEGEYYAKTRRI